MEKGLKMRLGWNGKRDAATLKLQGDVGIDKVTKLHEKCASVLRQSAGLTIDCSRATSLHLSVMQLLVSCFASYKKEGLAFELTGTEESAVLEEMRIAGLVAGGQRVGNSPFSKETSA